MQPIVLITVLLWIGTGMYVGGGIAGLSGTMDLFAEYGPAKGRGNPALDNPPDMWINPATGQWEPRDPDNPGNRVPQAFKIMTYILIGWAVVIFVTSIIFIADSIILNHIYEGRKTSDSAISCTAWLTGCSVSIAVAWFVQAGFAVLPLLEYRITMQRCWDLENPNFAPTTKRAICVDLVQYGLVLFRETDDSGFALVCGPGGNYDPPRGDLEGFCEVYSPTFVAFVLCFIGASVGIIALVIFSLQHGSNFADPKVRRYEGAPSRYYLGPGPSEKHPRQDRELSRTPSLSVHSDWCRGVSDPNTRQSGVNLVNPNHGSGIVEPLRSQPKVPEVMTFRRYRPDEDDVEMHAMESIKDSNSKYSQLSSDNESYDDDEPRESAVPPKYARSGSPLAYVGDHDEHESRRSKYLHADRSRHRRADHHRRDQNNESRSRNSEPSDRRRRRRASDEEELSERWSSDDGRSRRSRRPPDREELKRRDESPSSDYYMSEDRQRRSATRWG